MWFVSSFSKFLLNACYVLGIGDKAVIKIDKIPALIEFTS
jgi:hypothetical protein